MLFDRQRLLLTLLDALRDPVSNMDFQKLLFFYTQDCEKTPTYEFVPYKFGGFSFTSYADKRRLMEASKLREEDLGNTARVRARAREQTSEKLEAEIAELKRDTKRSG